MIVGYSWPTVTLTYLPVFEMPVVLTDDQAERALDETAEGLITLYKEEIEIVGAVDTRFFLDTVRVRSAVRMERDIASDAPYSGVVEHGWIYRARGQASYPGRWPAGRAIAKIDDVIGTAFVHQMMR